jgi:hypothetical protein
VSEERECEEPGCPGWDIFNERFEIQSCDCCKRFESDEDAAKHVLGLREKEKGTTYPPWLGVNFTTGDMWCRRCQTTMKLPVGSLKDAMEHLEMFIDAHRRCQWDAPVRELLDYAQHSSDCMIHVAGRGCTCFLEAFLKQMGAEEFIESKRAIHYGHSINREASRREGMRAIEEKREERRER